MGGIRSNRGWRSALVSLAGLAGVAGCSGEASPSADGTVTEVEVEVDVVASNIGVGPTFTPLVQSLVADESGVYWFGRGVWRKRPGDAEPVELRPAPERLEGESRAERVIGMADDAERLYVGQAFLQTGGTDFFPVPFFEPPGRLIVVPKDGGPNRVVVELEDSTITPIATDETRIIVFISGSTGGGYYQLLRSNIELGPLPLRAPFYSSSREGSTLYWSDDAYPPSLLRSGFDDAEPEVVAQMDRNEVAAGPGYVLSRRERLEEPGLNLAQNFVLYDAATGRERDLPGLGETISLTTALDARHAYWLSYPSARLGELALENPPLRLARVDIHSGALTLLNTPGYRMDPGATIVGQDDDTLYVESEDGLLAIEKP